MKELIYPHMFHPAVEQYTECEAVVDGDYRGTWSEHSGRVSRLGHWLANPLGILSGPAFGGRVVLGSEKKNIG